MTLSDLISVFEGYATQEDLIFHFEAREQMPNLSNEEEISTDALMQVVISSLNPSFDTTQVNIDFYFLKRLKRDRTNYASVMSDTFLLCADFQQYMEVNIAPTQGVNISFTNSALPVNNFDLDYTAGVTLSASIVYVNDGQCVVPPPPACNPVTYEITDTDENVLYSGSVVSGGELNQEIQDSTAVLKDTGGNTLSTTSILAEGSDDIVAPDAVVNFQYEDGTPIVTLNLPSGSTLTDTLSNAEAENSDLSYQASEPYGTTIQLPDITVTDSNGSTYTQPSVTDVFCTPCEGVDVFVGEANVGTFPSGSDVFVKVIQDGLEVIPEDVTVVDDEVSIILADTPPCPDTNIEVNGVSEGSVTSGSTIDVQLSDSGGTVTPDSVTLVGTDLQIVLPDAVAPTYIVDTYSPFGAFALFKLSSTATNCIRIRRSSDNAETDIGFDTSGNLDTKSIYQFVGMNSAYVTTYYDQSGNGKHRRQTSASNQPIIVESGIISTMMGKPSIKKTSTRFFNSSGAFAERMEFAANQRIDSFAVFQQAVASFVLYMHRIDTAFFNMVGQSGSGASNFTGGGSVGNHYKNGAFVTIANRGNTYTQLATNTPLIYTQINYVNTSQSITGLELGAYSGFEMQGFESVWLVFNNDQSANRVAIETLINDYYGIY